MFFFLLLLPRVPLHAWINDQNREQISMLAIIALHTYMLAKMIDKDANQLQSENQK